MDKACISYLTKNCNLFSRFSGKDLSKAFLHPKWLWNGFITAYEWSEIYAQKFKSELCNYSSTKTDFQISHIIWEIMTVSTFIIIIMLCIMSCLELQWYIIQYNGDEYRNNYSLSYEAKKSENQFLWINNCKAHLISRGQMLRCDRIRCIIISTFQYDWQ